LQCRDKGDVGLQRERLRGRRPGVGIVHRYRVISRIDHLHARRRMSPHGVGAGPLDVRRELPRGIRKPKRLSGGSDSQDRNRHNDPDDGYDDQELNEGKPSVSVSRPVGDEFAINIHLVSGGRQFESHGPALTAIQWPCHLSSVTKPPKMMLCYLEGSGTALPCVT